MQESNERPLRQILHAVENPEPDAHHAAPLPVGEVPEIGLQAAAMIRKCSEVSAKDLERAAADMRYAGARIAGDIEGYAALAFLVTTKTRAVTER
jgi:hypothetical protein